MVDSEFPAHVAVSATPCSGFAAREYEIAECLRPLSILGTLATLVISRQSSPNFFAPCGTQSPEVLRIGSSHDFAALLSGMYRSSPDSRRVDFASHGLDCGNLFKFFALYGASDG
jgi:hypothetical protein